MRNLREMDGRIVAEPFEVSYVTTGRKGKRTRNVIGVLCPTVLAQSLGAAPVPIFVSLGDVQVDWNTPPSAALMLAMRTS